MARATRVVDGGETPFKGAPASTSPTGTCPFIVAARIPKSGCKRNSTISMLAVGVLVALLTSLKAASVPSTLWLLHANIAAMTWLHRLLPIVEKVLPWPLRQLLFSQLVLAWLLWLLTPLTVRQVMIAPIPLVSLLCAFKYPALLMLRLRLLCMLLPCCLLHLLLWLFRLLLLQPMVLHVRTLPWLHNQLLLWLLPRLG